MWIRSQDKYKLTNANDIEIFDRENGEVWICVNGPIYAVYSTKEKALNVLGMIEGHINGNKQVIGTRWENGDPYDIIGEVFVMPQEEEV